MGAEVIMEGDDAREGEDENNPLVKDTRERIQVKSDKKQAMNFLTKLDRNRFTTLLDELANDLAKGINNYPNNVVEAMQLAQTYCSEGRVIGDMVTSHRDSEESAYVTEGYEYKKYIKERQKETMTEKRMQNKIKILNAIYVIRAVIIARIFSFLSKQRDM